MKSSKIAGIIAVIALSAGLAGGQTLSRSDLVKALQEGGYVIVMRHASSPRDTPNAQTANRDNLSLERQLDETGRVTSTVMGKALRDLGIRIGETLSSPTYRALETLKFAQLPAPKTHPELGDRGQSMQGVSEADGAWLREKAAQAPKSGNTLIVTHSPNMSRAFPEVSGAADGEALIYRPDGKGKTSLVGRVKIEDWPNLKR